MEVETENGIPRPLACDVTIVANDIGSVGGMERVLSELVIGLRALGHRVTVIARSCELPDGAGVDFHRVRGPCDGGVVVWFTRRAPLCSIEWM
jgi:hypothetical protein